MGQGKKTVIGTLQEGLAALDKKLEQLKKLEAQARGSWTTWHHRYKKAVSELRHLTRHGTKREKAIHAVIDTFEQKDPELTRRRDELREQLAEEQRNRDTLKRELDRVMDAEKARCALNDEIVNQVFALNETLVQASRAREGYVTSHVFPHLFDAKGRLRTQVTFTSTDGRRRVMARVNTITIVDHDLALHALDQIDIFKARVRPDPANTDTAVQMLFDLTDKLLVQRASFKVGPDLYRFLRLDLDPMIFPELVVAQNLLKQSIRSEKTEKYIRLWARANILDNFKPVRQS